MKLSILMPAYNSERTIRDSIDSVLSQSGAEIELIVVNDGSTDATGEILASYGDRIQAVSIPNGGVGNARNVALSHASGDYVMFVDSDDAIVPGTVETLMGKLADSGADMIRFEYAIHTPDGRVMDPRQRFRVEELIPKEQFRRKVYPLFIRGIQLNSLCTTLTKRSLFEGLQFRCDMKTAEDAYLLVDVYTRAKSLYVYPKPLYVYNACATSLTGKGLSVMKKYACNFALSRKIAGMLGEWGMASPAMYVQTYFRPIRLTLDKIKRNRDLK